jgi:hypothetical protein
MTIKLFESSLGEVPKKLWHLYRLDDIEQGGYKLSCDYDAHVHGLKSALQKQREENKRLRQNICATLESEATIPIGEIPFVKGDGPASDVNAGVLLSRSQLGMVRTPRDGEC